MDIGAGKSYPSNKVTNFAPHQFIFEDIKCSSMEGFLQSLKFSNPDMQAHICTLVGIGAKHKGRNKKWWRTQTLYWKGKPIKRDSQEYQDLLDRAYDALAENDGFQRALLATGKATLTHSIGKSDPKRTVLTEREFCSRLLKIRARLIAQHAKVSPT